MDRFQQALDSVLHDGLAVAGLLEHFDFIGLPPSLLGLPLLVLGFDDRLSFPSLLFQLFTLLLLYLSQTVLGLVVSALASLVRSARVFRTITDLGFNLLTLLFNRLVELADVFSVLVELPLLF